MEISIKQIARDEKESIVIISCGNKTIKASKDSDEWNSDKINEFLIEIATKCPDGEKLTINHNGNKNDQVFSYICELFQSFVEEYNKES